MRRDSAQRTMAVRSGSGVGGSGGRRLVPSPVSPGLSPAGAGRDGRLTFPGGHPPGIGTGKGRRGGGRDGGGEVVVVVEEGGGGWSCRPVVGEGLAAGALDGRVGRGGGRGALAAGPGARAPNRP